MSFTRKVRRKFEQLRKKLHANPGHVGALLQLRERKAPERSAGELERIEQAAIELEAELGRPWGR